MTGLQSLRGRRHVRSGDRPGGEPAIWAVTKARSEPPARPWLRDIAAEHNAPSVIFSAHDPQEMPHRHTASPPAPGQDDRRPIKTQQKPQRSEKGSEMTQHQAEMN